MGGHGRSEVLSRLSRSRLSWGGEEGRRRGEQEDEVEEKEEEKEKHILRNLAPHLKEWRKRKASHTAQKVSAFELRYDRTR